MSLTFLQTSHGILTGAYVTHFYVQHLIITSGQSNMTKTPIIPAHKSFRNVTDEQTHRQTHVLSNQVHNRCICG